MTPFDKFQEWVPTEENRYFKVSYTLREKEFDCYIKCSLDKKTWVSIFINYANPRDWFVRNETISSELWQFRKLSNKEEFELQLSDILNSING